jgi:hypothetical protein
MSGTLGTRSRAIRRRTSAPSDPLNRERPKMQPPDRAGRPIMKKKLLLFSTARVEFIYSMLASEQDKSTAGVIPPCTIALLTGQLDAFQSAGCCRCDN